MTSVNNVARALIPLLLNWRALMVIAVFGVGIAQLLPLMRPHAVRANSRTLNCESYDAGASAAVAALMFDSSGRGELRMDEALMQLRRARKNCRAGFDETAVNDYLGLSRLGLDDATASIQGAPR